jgi:hypothetical protein
MEDFDASTLQDPPSKNPRVGHPPHYRTLPRDKKLTHRVSVAQR